jgi:Zn-finger nucleic acid-binding protein
MSATGHLPRRDCPRCHTPLDEGAVDGFSVVRCLRCAGEFVEHESFRAMIEAREPETTPAHLPAPPRRAEAERDVRYLHCPICGEIMNRMNFGRRSGIMLDACKPHGTWFDRGELSATLAFVEGGGLVEGRASGIETDDVTKMAKIMSSALELERQQQAESVAEATDFVDDLLFILSPGDRHWAWGRRRRD